MRRARKRRVRAGAVDLADAGRAAGAGSAGAAAGVVDQSRAGSAHPSRANLALLWSRALQNPALSTCRQVERSFKGPNVELGSRRPRVTINIRWRTPSRASDGSVR